MNPEVYVVNFETQNGNGIIKAFRTKEEANAFLLKLLDRHVGDYLGDDVSKSELRMIYADHKRHGAFTGKVSKLKVVV